MIIVTFIGVLAVLLSFIRNRQFDGLKIAFVFLTLLGAIHYNYGNDYNGYYLRYLNYINSSFSWASLPEEKEAGWYLLNVGFGKIFGDNGFYWMIAFLSVLQNCIIYKLIKKYVDPKWFWLATFIYAFNTSYWLLGMSMLRQFLAMCLFAAIYPWIYQQRVILCLVLVLLISTIHSSAIILLPFIFVGYVTFLNRKKILSILVGGYLLLFFSTDYLESVFLSALEINEQFDQYVSTYEGGNAVTSFGLGYIIKLLPYVIAVWYYWTHSSNEKNKDMLSELKETGNDRLMVAVILFLCSAVIVIFTSILQMIGRLSLYFSLMSILVVPLVYSNIPNKVIRNVFLALFILITLWDYWLFFLPSSVFHDGFKEFHSILELI